MIHHNKIFQYEENILNSLDILNNNYMNLNLFDLIFEFDFYFLLYLLLHSY